MSTFHRTEKIAYCYIIGATILKIQDGCYLQTVLVDTTGFLVSENISLDTKIMSLSALELKI